MSIADRSIALTALLPGDAADVTYVDSANPHTRLQLSNLGVVPGARIRLQQCRPAIVLWVDETQLSLDRRVADSIRVQPV